MQSYEERCTEDEEEYIIHSQRDHHTPYEWNCLKLTNTEAVEEKAQAAPHPSESVPSVNMRKTSQ